MSRLLTIFVTGALCCMTAASVYADRLILIPTGRTLTPGFKAELAARSDEKAYWVHVGVSRVEIEGARFQDFGTDDVDVISAQLEIIPETTFTPGLALGARDIGDSTTSENSLYGGRAFYLAVSKGIPITGGVPFLFTDVKVHGGVGTDSLSGLFIGIEGTLPMGLRIAAEYDTEDVNYAVMYGVIPALQVKASSMKGDIYYGASFTTQF